MNQLFSQGTAGLLLDMCSDYWDGSQLKPLSNLDRSVCVVYVYDFLQAVLNEFVLQAEDRRLLPSNQHVLVLCSVRLPTAAADDLEGSAGDVRGASGNVCSVRSRTEDTHARQSCQVRLL